MYISVPYYLTDHVSVSVETVERRKKILCFHLTKLIKVNNKVCSSTVVSKNGLILHLSLCIVEMFWFRFDYSMFR